jgi:hypothetical protein
LSNVSCSGSQFVCVTIPRGTLFQFRCVGDSPLAVLGVTMPRNLSPYSRPRHRSADRDLSSRDRSRLLRIRPIRLHTDSSGTAPARVSVSVERWCFAQRAESFR